ncbi:unnamed protein product [Symbiodinium natans]|uniref:Uncharacterized protein n=1 Tax=Symbiodinium natans TaxID=878477 RepID=A0A812PAG7_9DINO|nr:unnamed protein product [Symbiodinium natans]
MAMVSYRWLCLVLGYALVAGRPLAETSVSKGDINSDNSSSNESVHTTEVPEPIGEHLARAAGLKTRMPVYLQTAAALLKPFLLALVLGPQRPGKKEPWHKPLQILILTVAPFVASFIADFRMTFHMWFFIDEEVKPTFRLLGTLMVIGNSPNLATSSCIAGSLMLTSRAHGWARQAQQPQHSENSGPPTISERLLSILLPCVTIVGSICFVVTVFPLSLFLVSTVVAYFYISLPLLFMAAVFGYRIGPYGMLGLMKLRKAVTEVCCPKPSGSYELCDLQPSEEVLKAYAKGLPEGLDYKQMFLEDKEWVELTGSTYEGWAGYFLLPAIAAFFPLASSVAVRLSVRDGYWPALVDSWNDRHWNTWIDHLLATGTKVVGNAKGVAPSSCHHYLEVSEKWLMVLSNLI